MSLQSIFRGFSAVVFIIALGFAGASCKVDPTYNGESVTCETDADCEHLTDGVFECDEDAGLCIRVNDVCEPECAEGSYCEGGVCVCDPECEEGLECNEAGVCVAVCEPQCEEGSYCEGGVCVCDPECEDGFECNEVGVCVEVCDPACEGDSYCEDGVCVCDPQCEDGFECNEVGVCVEVCDPACPHPLQCVDGVCDVHVEITSHGHHQFVNEGFQLEGSAAVLGSETDLAISCLVGDAGDTQAHVTLQHPVDEHGVLHAGWHCEITEDYLSDGPVEVDVVAEAGIHGGSDSIELLFDRMVPEVDIVVETDIEDGVVYEPKVLSFVIEVRDFMTPDTGEPDGFLGDDIAVELMGPTATPAPPALPVDECSRESDAVIVCAFELELSPMSESDWVAEGEYRIEVSASDEAGNHVTVQDVLFEIDMTRPELSIEVTPLDGSHEVEPEETPVVRRHERFRIDVEITEGIDRVLEGDDGSLVAPELQLREAALGDGGCTEDVDVALTSASGVGRYSAEVSARQPCLLGDEADFTIAATVRDKWREPVDPGEVHCGDEAEIEAGSACASVEITRHLWAEPANVCKDKGSTCTALTPAVDDHGQVYAAVNHGEAGDRIHEVFRVDPESGEKESIWTPQGGQFFQRALMDGPVVDEVDGDTQLYLVSDGLLWGVRSENDYWHTLDSDIGGDWGHCDFLGLPAIGSEGRVYVSVRDPEAAGGNSGFVRVMDPSSGSRIGGQSSFFRFEEPTSLAVVRGESLEWIAVYGQKYGGGVGDVYGGNVECYWPPADMLCERNNDSIQGVRRVGEIVAWDHAYFGVFESTGEDSEGTLRAFEWNEANEITQHMHPSITTGPVYLSEEGSDDALLVIGTSDGLQFLSISGNVDPMELQVNASVEGLGEVRSLSMGASGTVFALAKRESEIEFDLPRGLVSLQVVGFDGDEASLLWEIDEIGVAVHNATPIIADGGHTDFGEELGILYLPVDGKVHALITDESPAGGWPNSRGCAARQSAID